LRDRAQGMGFGSGGCPVMLLTLPVRKVQTEAMARAISTCESPSLSSGQQRGDCGLWSCRTIRFGLAFGRVETGA